MKQIYLRLQLVMLLVFCGSLLVYADELGDVNNDKVVDVADITNVVAMVLEPSLKDNVADLNFDNDVDVADVTMLVSAILGQKLYALDEILISGDYSSWGWEVSLDGNTFLYEGNSFGGEAQEVLVNGGLPFTVNCFGNDYETVFLGENEDGSIASDVEEWLYVERDESAASSLLVKALPFTVTSDLKLRKGYLFAVPAGVYDDFMQQLTAATSAVDFVDENINYVLVEATQRDIFAVDGFAVTTSSGEAVTCEPEPAGDFYDWVSSELSITDVFTFDGVNGATYTINTLYTDSDWGGGYALYSKSVPSISTRTWKFSRTKNDEGYYIFTLTVPAAEKFTEPVIIRLHTDNVNKKALIIKPVE